jgi:hypothetical protein
MGASIFFTVAMIHAFRHGSCKIEGEKGDV